MSAHTQGPWFFDGDKIKGNDKKTLQVCGVLMPCGYVPSDDVGYANARLIAAAPELLEALKEAKNGLRYWEPQTAYGASERARICALVDAAITKATGVDQ